MTQLTKEQKDLLRTIVTDKYSVGAFAGMVFNASVVHPVVEIEDLISKALNVRLKMEELIR